MHPYSYSFPEMVCQLLIFYPGLDYQKLANHFKEVGNCSKDCVLRLASLCKAIYFNDDLAECVILKISQGTLMPPNPLAIAYSAWWLC